MKVSIRKSFLESTLNRQPIITDTDQLRTSCRETAERLLQSETMGFPACGKVLPSTNMGLADGQVHRFEENGNLHKRHLVQSARQTALSTAWRHQLISAMHRGNTRLFQLSFFEKTEGYF